ncbi:helix-turn-helix transcriptional regulator [Peribacillus aracenensis]|uniref:helix-turn-helix transcriptional regulator n=1 Tax=Peribacillus aracenensis TaxID=2976708 RepID=UPI0021A2B839|nr:hybrid sensor histidine kinase/response regulator transcription factor [Peribacillus sp. BBB004]
MFYVVKQWFWYDWFLLFIRLIVCISLIFAIIEVHEQLPLPLWSNIVWGIIAFSVPWLCLLYNYNYYLITEMILFGGIILYLSYWFPEAYLGFLMPAFMIAANGFQNSYRWSGPMTVLVIPILILILSHQVIPWLPIIHIGLAYGFGFSFHLLIVNHKQNKVIREQNIVLEQYMSQIERITLLEERNRMAKELHDTIGHSNVSIIMGLESLRTYCSNAEGEKKLELLLDLTRKNMDDIRGYLHQMESTTELLPLHEALRQLIDEFQTNAGVNVHYRILGEVYPIPRQVHMTFYRCLQESLTNAVRHGGSTEMRVVLQFEPRQTRLEVQDNGRDVDNLEEGFGLTAIKKRASNLQGQINVYSKSEEGTIVTCTLPRQMESPGEVIRLLIVDDQPFIRESLRTILEKNRDLSIVGLAGDGEQAMEICERVKPQMMLMDINMPNMDGITAMKLIKQRWPDIRILILTSFQETEKAMEALRSGADGYLLKSMDPSELAETIRLIYRGCTMIDQDISNKLFEEVEKQHIHEHSEDNPINDMDHYGLTPREIEILKMVSKGFRYKTIASKLYLSDGTVRNYASNVYAKLEVRNREEAVQKAGELGLLE